MTEENKKKIDELYQNLDYDKVAEDFSKRVKGKKPRLNPENIVSEKEFKIE